MASTRPRLPRLFPRRIIELPLVVMVQAFAIVGLREMAAATATGDVERLATTALACIRRVLTLVLPVAALAAFFSCRLLGAPERDRRSARRRFRGAALVSTALFATVARAVFVTTAHVLARLPTQMG